MYMYVYTITESDEETELPCTGSIGTHAMATKLGYDGNIIDNVKLHHHLLHSVLCIVFSCKEALHGT